MNKTKIIWGDALRNCIATYLKQTGIVTVDVRSKGQVWTHKYASKKDPLAPILKSVLKNDDVIEIVTNKNPEGVTFTIKKDLIAIPDVNSVSNPDWEFFSLKAPLKKKNMQIPENLAFFPYCPGFFEIEDVAGKSFLHLPFIFDADIEINGAHVVTLSDVGDRDNVSVVTGYINVARQNDVYVEDGSAQSVRTPVVNLSFDDIWPKIFKGLNFWKSEDDEIKPWLFGQCLRNKAGVPVSCKTYAGYLVYEAIKMFAENQKVEDGFDRATYDLFMDIYNESEGGCLSLKETSGTLHHPKLERLYDAVDFTYAPALSWAKLKISEDGAECGFVYNGKFVDVYAAKRIGELSRVNYSCAVHAAAHCALATNPSIIKGSYFANAAYCYYMLISSVGAVILKDSVETTSTYENEAKWCYFPVDFNAATRDCCAIRRINAGHFNDEVFFVAKIKNEQHFVLVMKVDTKFVLIYDSTAKYMIGSDVSDDVVPSSSYYIDKGYLDGSTVISAKTGIHSPERVLTQGVI